METEPASHTSGRKARLVVVESTAISTESRTSSMEVDAELGAFTV